MRPQIASLAHGAHIVVGTPGRILDHLSRETLPLDALNTLVLDEADRMLDMGFVPAIRQIVKLLPRKRQTLFFSATLSREIEKLTGEFLTDPEKVEIGRRSNPAETVSQSVYEISQPHKPALLSHLLRDHSYNMVLVFTRTKHGADRIAKRLSAEGITTGTLHSNRSQNQRLRALTDFKEGKVRVLVATDIAARGIDVEGISHVINFDFPPHHEDYVHRIGRTGRAKAVGEAVSFVSKEDQGSLRSLERFIGRGIPRLQAQGLDLSSVASRREPRRPGEVRGSGTPSRDGGRQAGSPRRQSRGARPERPREISMSGEPAKKPSGGVAGKKGVLGRFLGFGRR
jgi:ATP-dependent RNA helicase RhlE